LDLSGCVLERLREDTEFVLYRSQSSPGKLPILVLAPASRSAECTKQARFAHEQTLSGVLDPKWAVQPLSLARHEGRTVLVLRDPGGQPLDAILAGQPLELTYFLQIAVGIATALRQVHASGLIHKDIKPSNVFVSRDGTVRLTGFGFASRLPRERQAPAAPDVMAGTLAYMAPEQTGRINRSVDNRSDLYSLGITLYEMIAGALPFSASDSMDWIHCHIARQPPPPSVRVEGVPIQLETMILKLLAKNAEDRYQTAAGIENDLRRCLTQIRASQNILPFPLGERDESERLLIPEKLYGREHAIGALAAAYQRVAVQGQFEVLLVSGHSGVGKSSAVNELLKSMHSTNGLFASGKVDRHNRDIPYSTLSEAFRRLLRHILSEDDLGLEHWRSAIRNAVGVNGRLMSDLFPDLALILHDQLPLPIVPAQEAKSRFHEVFRRFISVFAQPEHPLVLFIDDLQWLDAATLDLLEWLIADEHIPYLLMIGAYRSDELECSTGLMRLFKTICRAVDAPTEVALSALSLSNLNCLIAETLHAEPATVSALAELVFKKTQGNPFFTVQFLTSLNVEGLLYFESAMGTWRWDLERIRNKGITDNVAQLLAEKLARFGEEELELLRQLACLGSSVRTATLSVMLGVSEDRVDSLFRPFVAVDLVNRYEHRYAFAHDRVQEAAYALIPGDERAHTHLKIGRRLLGSMGADQLEENIFEIVNQLNRGAILMGSGVERQQLAELNLIAGKRAKASAAYESAVVYLGAGCALLAPDCWTHDYRTTFELELHRAECQFLIGDVAFAEERLAALSDRSTELTDLAIVVTRQLTLYTYLGRADRAVELSLDCLARMGVELPLHPTVEMIEEEYLRLVAIIGDRPIATLVDLPEMCDPRWREAMDLLHGLTGPAGMLNANLLDLLALRIVNISLLHGNCDEVCLSYALIGGLICGWRFGSFDLGQQFGKLALSLIDEKGFDRYAGRVYQSVAALISPYRLPLRECLELLLRATEVGPERGGLVFAGYGWSAQVGMMIDSGTLLEAAHQRAEAGLAFVQKRKFALAIEYLVAQRLYLRALRGLTADLSFNDGDFNEDDYERHLDNTPHLLHANVRYRIRKLQLQFYSGDYAKCMELVAKLDGNLSATPFWESIAEFPFFAALARAVTLVDPASKDMAGQLDSIKSSHIHLIGWAQRCPENFSDRAHLVAAEIARLEGKELEAQHLYDEAVRLAREHGFVQNEGLANELAARFYASRGFEVIADAYRRNARACYVRWGANGKVRQLDRLHPHLIDDTSLRMAMTFGGESPLQRFDLAAVVAMHQAVSREIVLDRLIERLMTTATEYAGAVRGLLLLPREGVMAIVAEAITDRQTVTVNLRPQSEVTGKLPRSILNYVVHAREVVILGDARQSNLYSADEYVRGACPRAILCIPLVKQNRLVGVLYLENNLSAHTFTKDRLLVLQLLASQAAISIENAELFLNAQGAQEESRRVSEELRQSFDTIPALAWRASAGGALEFSNKQWHDYTGISHEDASGASWMRSIHPDDVEKVGEKWRHLTGFRTSGEFEARMRRFDGEFRSFLTRVTPMRDERGEVLKWHGTQTDIENLKRAEHAQEALARVTRVTAMGELTVSIAHEINQPLMAIVTNAATCLRWLNENQINIGEARLAAERVIRDGHRAGDIIASIRALAKKSPPKPAQLDLNELVEEVLSLTHNELDRHAIITETEFATAAPVLGDRVQMQQVILNLIMNGIEAISAGRHEPRSLKIRSQRGEPGFVLVTIADTGIGLGAADREQIFDVFYTTKQDGMGIGLSICRSIVEAHGGRLWASANVSVGSVFHMTLPTFAQGLIH
jgi:PAS domain S-box-containing protein